MPKENEQIKYATHPESKYKKKPPLENIFEGENESSCHFDIAVEWTNDVGSGVFSTPLLVDFLGTGQKQIIVSAYHQYIEILDGEDGTPIPGWPYIFPSKEFISSPFLVDIDFDGRQELGVATKTGEIIFFGVDGLPIRSKTIKLGKLPVHKNWYEGLDTASGHVSFSLLNHKDPSLLDDDPYDYFYDNYYDYYGNDFAKPTESNNQTSEFVYIDAHILATPVVDDIDGDGYHELIVPVTYYFDKETYMDQKKRDQLGKDIDISQYVACGLAIYDLKSHTLKKLIPLDLTTNRAEFRAYLVSSPTLFDLDGDGSRDIIVGTAVGFLYAINHEGIIRKNFPITMDEIHTQVLVGDFQNTGQILLIAIDRNGNIVAFNKEGQEIWENRVTGYPPEKVEIGDINNDGELDIVMGTTSGSIWALSAKTGTKLPFFPVRTGEIRAPVTLTQLSPGEPGTKSLTIIVPSLDGYLYLVDSDSGCVETIDIGEKSYAQVLVDDVRNNGNVDLILATQQGNIFCLSTPAEFHPLKTVPSRINYQGIYVLDSTRNIGHVTGGSFNLHIQIEDSRDISKIPNYFRKYRVKVFLGGSILLHEEDFTEPGVYILKVSSPKQRISSLVIVQMTNEINEKFVDSFSISFNSYFYRILKWAVTLPFFLVSFFILFARNEDLPLPK